MGGLVRHLDVCRAGDAAFVRAAGLFSSATVDEEADAGDLTAAGELDFVGQRDLRAGLGEAAAAFDRGFQLSGCAVAGRGITAAVIAATAGDRRRCEDDAGSE